MDVLTRWRLILGGGDADGTDHPLPASEAGMDAALDALYEFERRKKFKYQASESPEYANGRKGGRGTGSPAVARWLGDIRRYFPQSVVQVMQKDALGMPQLKKQMLMDPEVLSSATPDIHLVATLLELKHLMPEKTKAAARQIVQQVVDDLIRRLQPKTEQAVSGAFHRHLLRRTTRWTDTDWKSTIKKNLRHYQPELKTIIPEVKIGFTRKNRRIPKEIILCIDQSGSMSESVVYAGIYSAVLASLPGIQTRLLAFDTQVIDLSEQLNDPVDLLFGIQLGGGTDIHAALSYCQTWITRPTSTILVLLSDLFEGGDKLRMREKCRELATAGVQMIALLALGDEGAPAYDRENAAFLAHLGIPVFACTPDRFPEVMAAAIEQQDLSVFSTIPLSDFSAL